MAGTRKVAPKAVPKAALRKPDPGPRLPRGRIVTFYSYKGGTGRSMALANVAWILASRGERVLAIDWDLEAPGLHRYFGPFLDDKELTQTPGLIDLFADFVEGSRLRDTSAPADWFKPYASVARHAFSLDCEFPGEGTLDLLAAGRQGPGYAARVTGFDWSAFYERLGGGVFLEALKQNLRAEYDFVLIDSRTGISDTSGICTIQMPDDLVVCFTLNTQSIRGAAAVAESAFEQRKRPSGEPGLRIWPVPTRVELAERDRLEAARDGAHQRFQKFLHHLAPAQRPSYWGQVEVLYQPYFAYEEALATLVERRNQTGSLLRSFEFLTACFSDGAVTELGEVATAPAAAASDLGDASFYLSYALRDGELAERLVEGLRRHLGRNAILWDRDLLAPGDDWAQVLSGAMNRAVAVMPLLTVNYLQGNSAPREAAYALMRQMRVVPVTTDQVSFDELRKSPSALGDQLLRFQAASLRTGDGNAFDDDVARLAGALREVALSARMRRGNAGRQPDADDPLRGRFGQDPRRDGWQLTAQVGELGPDWFAVTLEVRGTRKQPLVGAVEFHLHPTFDPALHVVRSHDGVARLELQAWGAFTVGAVVLDTMTPLELNLGSVSSAPRRFRER